MNNEKKNKSNLAEISVFSGASTLLSAPHSCRLASGPRTAGGRQKLQSECGIGGRGRHAREINMQKHGKGARAQARGCTRRLEGGFNGASKK